MEAYTFVLNYSIQQLLQVMEVAWAAMVVMVAWEADLAEDTVEWEALVAMVETKASLKFQF